MNPRAEHKKPNIIFIDGRAHIEYGPGEFYPLQPPEYPSEDATPPKDVLVPPNTDLPPPSIEAPIVCKQDALDSICGLFTPVGWGTGIKLSGLTATRILSWAANLLDNSEVDPRIVWGIMESILGHSREVLRLSGFIKGTTTKVNEYIELDGIVIGRESEQTTLRLSPSDDTALSAGNSARFTTEALRAELADIVRPSAHELVENE